MLKRHYEYRFAFLQFIDLIHLRVTDVKPFSNGSKILNIWSGSQKEIVDSWESSASFSPHIAFRFDATEYIGKELSIGIFMSFTSADRLHNAEESNRLDRQLNEAQRWLSVLNLLWSSEWLYRRGKAKMKKGHIVNHSLMAQMLFRRNPHRTQQHRERNDIQNEREPVSQLQKEIHPFCSACSWSAAAVTKMRSSFIAGFSIDYWPIFGSFLAHSILIVNVTWYDYSVQLG